MSGPVSTAGLGTSTKLIGLTKHTKHGHLPSPVSPYFVAPPAQSALSFNSIALAAAIARTATTWDDAPVVLLDGLQQSALIELETLLQDGSAFALESHFKFLADTAGSQFAAKVGAGIAHLYMDALGYAWRANAACLSSSLDPHADFIYEGGNASGHGVVLAEAHGSGRVRTTVEQKMIVLDVEEGQVDSLVEGLEALDLTARPSTFRRGTMACTGIEFCKLALVETKARARTVVAELESRLPDFDVPFSIHVNGCPNSCARTQVADVGLKGMVQKDEDGNLVEVFQVHLGGGLGTEPSLARKTRALKVRAEDLPDYVERLAGRYLAQRDAGESFAAWARRADEDDLR